MSSFEQLFQIQLTENGQSIDELVNSHFAQLTDHQKFPHERVDLEGFCKFLFISGKYEKIIQLFLKVAEIDQKLNSQSFPWILLLESMLRLNVEANQNEELPEHLKNSLLEAMKEMDLKSEFARSEFGRKFFPALNKEFSVMRESAEENLYSIKRNLLDMARAYEVQNLFELQKLTLDKLKRIDPSDHQVADENKKLAEKKALDVLARKSVFHQKMVQEEKDESLLPEMAEFISLQMMNSVQNKEYAVVFATWGYPELALQFLLKIETADSESDWLQCELLLDLGRFAELLSALHVVEQRQVEDSDAFFKTAYLRAQAFWGLGQKERAIETMESLLTSKPHYRAGQTLLLIWRSE